MRLRLISTCMVLWAFDGGLAWASLGGSNDSVLTDRARLAAVMKSDKIAGRPVQTLTLANGAVRKELVTAQGSVFAVTWRGRSKPDLRQLLGPYFARFEAESASQSGRRTRRALVVESGDLVVHSSGANGAFWGYAYLPPIIPDNFSRNEIDPVRP